MTVIRKKFRVEQASVSHMEPANADPTFARDQQHREILDEIASLKELIQPSSALSEQVLAEYKDELRGAMKLKAELDEMYEAITRTKREIATLHHSGFEGEQMLRVTDELDAIVIGTERATESILSAAEMIDERAGALGAMVSGQPRDLASDISEHVVAVFEACNFQDLTGQRITKVVNTLRFIEERIVRMMEIWGGIDSFADLDVDKMPSPTGDDTLLNGPALESDNDIASQDDIDALFS